MESEEHGLNKLDQKTTQALTKIDELSELHLTNQASTDMKFNRILEEMYTTGLVNNEHKKQLVEKTIEINQKVDNIITNSSITIGKSNVIESNHDESKDTNVKIDTIVCNPNLISDNNNKPIVRLRERTLTESDKSSDVDLEELESSSDKKS